MNLSALAGARVGGVDVVWCADGVPWIRLARARRARRGVERRGLWWWWRRLWCVGGESVGEDLIADFLGKRVER